MPIVSKYPGVTTIIRGEGSCSDLGTPSGRTTVNRLEVSNGTLSVTAAPVTPGMARTASRERVIMRTIARSSGYELAGRVTAAVTTRSAEKPGSQELTETRD